MKAKSFAWASILSGLFLALAILPGTLQAEETLKIGILAPFDFPVGKGIRQGAELAAEEINANGGIIGKQIQLIFSDDKFKADIGAYEYMKLVQEDKVAAVVGTASSEVALAVMEQMAKYKVPFLSTGAASPRITSQIGQNYDKYKYAFRLCHGSDELADLSGSWILHLVKTRKIQKVAMMIESAVWTKQIAETWENRLKETGVEIPIFEYFYKNAKDFKPTLSKIIENKSEMICMVSAHVSATKFISTWADMKGPILTGIVAGSYATLWESTAGKVLSITVTETPGVMGLTSRDSPFCEKYLKKYNAPPEYATPYTYDAMYILKAGIEKAKSPEPDALADALEKTDNEGVAGKWVFEKSHYSKRQLTMAQWQNDGKMCIVWPENVKTCEFILPPWYEKR